MIYTSGSTGRPKGAAITRGGLSNYLEWAARTYPADGGGTALFLSPAFDLSVTSLFLPWLQGEPSVIFRGRHGFDDLADALREGRRFGCLKMTPSHLRLLQQRFRSAAAGVCSLRHAHSRRRGSRHGARGLVAGHWPRTRIFNEYGPTETVVGLRYTRPGRQTRATIPIGRAIANAVAYVADESMTLAPDGVEGELACRRPRRRARYLGKADLTAELPMPDPCGRGIGARVYCTGDRAAHTGAVLQCRGCADQQVKIAGYRVELAEVEAALTLVDGVAGAIVLAVEDGAGERTLAAVLTRDVSGEREGGARAGESGPGAGPRAQTIASTRARRRARRRSVERVRRDLARLVPDFLIPAWISLASEMALTASGKVDRGAPR